MEEAKEFKRTASTAGGSVAFKERKTLFQDAMRRLLKNRAAVIGGIIIILLILMAVFAGRIAPYHYAENVLEEENNVPAWLLEVFPSMKPYANINNKYVLGADPIGRDPVSYTHLTLPMNREV